MKIRLYPCDRSDRFFFWVASGLLGLAGIVLLSKDIFGLVFLAGALLIFALIYAFPTTTTQSDVNEFSVVIGQIAGIEQQLSNLSEFLKRERQRVADTESTLSRLQDEKTKLEPIVLTQRQTVEAILAAHSSRVARSVWKERLVGFVLGTLASILATFVYQYFKR